jgi:hypothetical protein
MALVDAADELADLVTHLIRVHLPRFPLLADSLRGNVALTDATDYAWLPSPGPKTKSGLLAKVNWVDNLGSHRGGTTPLGAVHVLEDVFGHQIEVMVKGSERRAATVTLKAETGEAVAIALAANIRAIAAVGGKVRDLANIEVATQSQDIVGNYAADQSALQKSVAQYRTYRSQIDDTLAAML